MIRTNAAALCAALALVPACGDSDVDDAFRDAVDATRPAADVGGIDVIPDVGGDTTTSVSDADATRVGDGSVLMDSAEVTPGDTAVGTDIPVTCETLPLPPGAQVTAEGRFEHLDGVGAPGILDRRLTVYLPAGYDTDADRHYPVLYAHDGQNLFFDQLSFAGEWRLDETLDAGVASGALEPVIAVGVYNTAERFGDYTPTVDSDYGGGNAAAYADYLADVVRPVIDGRYRTRCEASATGVLGSSLGGLASLFIAMRRPDRFGRVGVVSPSLWWDGQALVAAWESAAGVLPARLWLDMGTAESTGTGVVPPLVHDVRRVRDAALGRGMVMGQDLGYLEALGAGHNEGAWRARLPSLLRFLFGAAPFPTADRASAALFSGALGVGEQTSAIVETGHGADGRLTWPNTDVTFSAAPPGVVTIAPDGTVTGDAAGSAAITAEIAGVSADVAVTVGSGGGGVAVTFVVDVPIGTPASDTIYIAGDRAALGDWGPGAVPMTQAAANTWSITLTLAPGLIEYKFTRGSWETVETQVGGTDIGNRKAQIVGAETLTHAVAAWKQ